MADSPISPSGSLRRHGRNISQPLVRRSTKGPLDAVDDPLAEPVQSTSVASSSSPEPSTALAEAQQAEKPLPEPAGAHGSKAGVDVRFLQDPNLYHPLSLDDVAPPFLDSAQQPPPGTSLANLLQGGHFRRAADAAANDLLRCSPNNAEQVLSLFYTRLACLLLVSRPDLAAQEASPLLNLLAQNAPGVDEIVSIVPWELRLLLVRLQSLATADGGRRGIMALYTLAAEVRAHVKQARTDDDATAIQLWIARLQDLGLRVADALVEMGELDTANRHLQSLTDVDADEVRYRKALLRIRVGDIAGANNCVASLEDETRKSMLEALLKVADGDYEAAADSWQSLLSDRPGHAVYSNNAQVAMLYTGHIVQAREALENVAQDQTTFPSLLFNLSTAYELTTERAPEHKAALAQKLAAKAPAPDSGGWEKSNVDFKL